MLGPAWIFIAIFLNWTTLSVSEDSDLEELGTNLVEKMRNDVNLDLSVDEEYEDLRAELLAYHSVLASLTSPTARRSMGTTPCWGLGGICINYKLCSGFRYLTEVPGCKGKFRVCCFTWNRYQVRDMTGHGISNAGFPWSLKQKFGGEGIKVKGGEDFEDENHQFLRKKFRTNNANRTLAFILQ